MSNIQKKAKTLALVILDGWGLWGEEKGNAIAQADTPVMAKLYKKYPNIQIQASEKYVGLPDGQPGNSEAGHMNIGAGRVIEQDAVTISRSINNGTFFKNPAFLQAASHAEKHKSDIHLIGLLSNGTSPHSHDDHILSLLSFFISKTKQNIYLHLFTDGRDSPPYSALKILAQYNTVFNSDRVKIASVMGRFYAMDRKKAWDRTRKAYEAIVIGKGYKAKSAVEAVNQAYNRGESDEFILPTVISKNKKPLGPINDNDSVVFFNLRSDRARQLTKAFVQKDFEKKNGGTFKRQVVPKNLIFVALTDFGPDLGGVLTAYPGIDIPDTLPIALKDVRQLYIAETEKYAHVTYFINGGYDHPIAGEDRIDIPSKDVLSYDKKPEMSTKEITDKVIQCLKNDKYDFFCINFAAPDMVGHTGNLKAGIKAVEAVDKHLGRIVDEFLKFRGTVIVTADHGNVEEMINLKTQEIDTEHSINPVPFIIVSDKKYKLKKTGRLSHIAPTILDIMGIDKPILMKDNSLIK
ncbi:2,3-bisphosphoglycerate-independent phosphoglycerate mutase [Patescibacteria group bacterium]|nr:2,3-bisphosphoglycerate-independent phosphoglycerate mutase [Patescibacteria group bacterium]